MGVTAVSAKGRSSAAPAATTSEIPLDASSTPASATANVTAPPPMEGKVALITGASTGIGLATAEGLARSGVYGTLVLAGRDAGKHELAMQQIRSSAPETLRLEFLPVDLASLQSVRDLVKAFSRLGLPLHTLVLNAGVMALPSRQLTADGYEYQLGVNHLSHFLLTNLLLDTLVASSPPDDPARVIALSSSAHRFPSALQTGDLSELQQEKYSAWGAYGQSKLANLLFAYELDRRCRERGLPLSANAVHPGVVNTELFENDGALTGPLKSIVRGALSLAALTPEEGAKTSVRLATLPDGKLSGKYWQSEKPTASLDSDSGLPGGLQKLLRLPAGRTSYDTTTWSALWVESEKLVGLQPEDVAAFKAE